MAESGQSSGGEADYGDDIDDAVRYRWLEAWTE